MPNPIMTCNDCIITNLERLLTIYDTEFPKFIERNYQASKNQPEPEPTEKIQKKPSKKKTT